MKNVLLKNGIDLENVYFYGNDICKLDLSSDMPSGKLVLVTSINPTIYGEGKTTVSIGLVDGLCRLGYKATGVLREPSLGPVFGRKGGACGGGKSTIEPSEKINLHFTGDMHAITTANNMISSAIDNHIYYGNELHIDLNSIFFKRAIDINDRALRNVEVTIGPVTRVEHFQITAASELMAIFCLSKSLDELKSRIDDIIFALDTNGNYLYVKDLHCTDAIVLLLKDAFLPNGVLTSEGNLVLVHGGPFANIAQGTSSVKSILTALSHFDIVVTEAGFGSDLGGIKYFDIVSRNTRYPDLVCINASIRSLKYNGFGSLEKGICNLDFHLFNMRFFSSNILVLLNRFEDDTEEEIEFVKKHVESLGYHFSVIDNYAHGSKGSTLASLEVVACLKQENKVQDLYPLDISLEEKIEIMLKHLGAGTITYDALAKEKLAQFNHFPYPVCIAKTPMSISDDEEKLGFPKDFKVTIKDISVLNGAKFIVVYLGNILTLPGLSKDANLYKIKGY